MFAERGKEEGEERRRAHAENSVFGPLRPGGEKAVRGQDEGGKAQTGQAAGVQSGEAGGRVPSPGTRRFRTGRSDVEPGQRRILHESVRGAPAAVKAAEHMLSRTKENSGLLRSAYACRAGFDRPTPVSGTALIAPIPELIDRGRFRRTPWSPLCKGHAGSDRPADARLSYRRRRRRTGQFHRMIRRPAAR